MAADDGTMRLWDLNTWQEVIPPRPPQTKTVLTIAFAPGAERIGTSGDNGTVELWGIPGFRPLGQFPASRDSILSLSFSPDGRTICTGGSDGVLKLWIADKKKELQRSPSPADPDGQAINSVVFSPDGGTVAWGGDDGMVRLWDVSKGQEISKSHGHDGSVTDLRFSSRSRFLASGGG